LYKVKGARDKMALVLGIDEAGRGPVIGPMVMCGVVVEKKDEKKLHALGVKDSKMLAPERREELYEAIKDIAKDFRIIIVQPDEIDEALNSPKSNLNLLEASKTAHIISMLKPDTAYIDCPSNNIDAYINYIVDQTKNTKTKIIAEHKADTKFISVAAASILAKVTRDREITKLQRKHKVSFGSGYPSDPFTKQFLEANYNKYPFFRKSWASWKNAAAKNGQKKLTGF